MTSIYKDHDITFIILPWSNCIFLNTLNLLISYVSISIYILWRVHARLGWNWVLSKVIKVIVSDQQILTLWDQKEWLMGLWEFDECVEIFSVLFWWGCCSVGPFFGLCSLWVFTCPVAVCMQYVNYVFTSGGLGGSEFLCNKVGYGVCDGELLFLYTYQNNLNYPPLRGQPKVNRQIAKFFFLMVTLGLTKCKNLHL